jgi:organic hydroperoxide reductase OsmC/OhrA
MSIMTIRLKSIPSTGAAAGWAGGHTVVVDRPEGKAGGTGLGFNGGQLLGLAIGGCFCNDLQYVAHDMGIALSDVEVAVDVKFDGTPLVATGARMRVHVVAQQSGADVQEVVRRAEALSTVKNSVERGFRVEVDSGPSD